MAERLIRQRLFFFGMVVILAILTLILVWQFTKSILLAVALVVILKPLYNWILKKKWVKGSESRATGVTIIIFILLIAIPAVLIIGGAVSQASKLFSGLEIEGIDFSLLGIITWLEETIRRIGVEGAQIDEAQFTESVQQTIGLIGDWLGDLLVSLGQSIPKFFTNAMIVLVIMFVLLPVYKRPGKQDILNIVPFPPEITQLFLDKVDLMITAMFKGTFVIAIVDGAVMGLIFWIAGVPYVMFLTVLSMFLSLIPFIGLSLVAWPVGIILILSGNTWQGIFVIAAFLVIVSNIDTILRPVLVPKGAYLNPALIILSVFGGLGVMGLIGAIYGPVVMILLVTSIEVYTKFMLRSDLQTLDEEGRIDLEELGLVPEEDQEEQKAGEMFVTALKNLSVGFRQGAQDRGSEVPADEQVPGESTENPA